MKPLARIALLNPNTNAATTEAMLAIARNAAGALVSVEGRTAPWGVQLITTETLLASAAAVVAKIGPDIAAEGFDAIVIGGFGDPGLEALRSLVSIPVAGIAESGMADAAAGGRRFSVVTTTPDLADSIRASAARYGHADQLVSVRITDGDTISVMSDARRLERALVATCARAIEDGAQSIVIGGGPLAAAAVAIATNVPVPVIEPVCAGVRHACRLLGLLSEALHVRVSSGGRS